MVVSTEQQQEHDEVEAEATRLIGPFDPAELDVIDYELNEWVAP